MKVKKNDLVTGWSYYFDHLKNIQGCVDFRLLKFGKRNPMKTLAEINLKTWRSLTI